MTPQFHKLIVGEVRRETPDTVSLILQVPEDWKKTFQYAAGQYLTLRFQINGKEHRRAYSMSSSPVEDTLAVTVKRVPKGIVSSYIHDQVRAGDPIEVMPPQGRFVVETDEEKRRSYFLFGAGSGITPLMSILKTVLEQEPKSEVHLLYGSRDEDNIIFKEELGRLESRYAGQLRVENILSRPKRSKSKGLGGLFSKGSVSWEGKTGRIDPGVVDKFLSEAPNQNEDCLYYICGPGNMNPAVEQHLLQKGLDPKQVLVEHFTNETPPSANGQASEKTHAQIHVQLDGEEFEIEVQKGKTILDAILDSNREAPYSCYAGACSTCVARLKKGTVQMDTCLALDEEEVEQGLILTCQSHPTSEEVEISYDDV
jgi:ring-1,2-phenylacetyl-CoA epoxidase subunit PaaE